MRITYQLQAMVFRFVVHMNIVWLRYNLTSHTSDLWDIQYIRTNPKYSPLATLHVSHQIGCT
jgi:hypothetical protein